MNTTLKIENGEIGPEKLMFEDRSSYTRDGSAYLCTLPTGEKLLTSDNVLASKIAAAGGSWIEYVYFKAS